MINEVCAIARSQWEIIASIENVPYEEVIRVTRDQVKNDPEILDKLEYGLISFYPQYKECARTAIEKVLEL